MLDDLVPYSFEEFLRHWTDYQIVQGYEFVDGPRGEQIEIGSRQDFETTAFRVSDYIRQLYGGTDLAKDKARLFQLMFCYLADHRADFDIVTVALLRSVHHFFTRQPLSQMRRDPAVREVIQLAQKYEEENPYT